MEQTKAIAVACLAAFVISCGGSMAEKKDTNIADLIEHTKTKLMLRYDWAAAPDLSLSTNLFTMINAVNGGEITYKGDVTLFEAYQFVDKDMPPRLETGLGSSDCVSKGYFLLCASKSDDFSIEDLKWLIEDF